MADAGPAHNRIIDHLPAYERSRVLADLVPVTLHLSTVLVRAGQALPRVVFPTGGVVSLVVEVADGDSIEAALVGDRGIVGGWHAVGVAESPWLAVVLASGPALEMNVDTFRAHVEALPSLGRLVHRSNFATHLQTAQSTACYRFHDLFSRAARWLLMLSDRTHSSEITLTHELFSQMLGAHRPSVTVTLRDLERAGLIARQRSRITILDHERLLEASCECYAQVEGQIDRLVS